MKKSESNSKTSNKLSSVAGGILILFSAPSGCGKTTIVDRLLKRHPDWVRSVSATTRAARVGEKEGRDYFFLSPRIFKQMQSRGELLESATVFGRDYGTPKAFVLDHLKAGKNVILAIDVQGAEQVRKITELKGMMLTFFVLPPSVKVLRERLEGRKTESPEEIQRRIENAQEEIKAAQLYDYAIVNQNLDKTIVEIEDRVQKFQKKRRPKSHAVYPA